ncbi:MAG: zinc dependent phospholipase C family protein [Clostridiales bacterium]|nr:zinc dependent phospholipase C family protein [Clostridiales bacterium]
MPTTYAHFYFGRRAEPLLPETAAEAVRKNLQLYDIGLHGPDILFYYQPLKSNPIGRLGGTMHDRPASAFFYPARAIYASAENREGAMAYLVGFLCHYALDSACHGYIEKKLTVSELTHGEIESEFDRYLMQKDGKDVVHTDVTAHIVPSPENASVIAPFFADMTAGQIRRTLRAMKLFCGLLSGRGWRRPVVDVGLKLSGQYERLHRMVMAKRPLPESDDSNLRLEKLLNRALEQHARLIGPYLAFLDGGAFPEGLEQTFGPSDGWRELPVLSAEEERCYEI